MIPEKLARNIVSVHEEISGCQKALVVLEKLAEDGRPFICTIGNETVRLDADSVQSAVMDKERELTKELKKLSDDYKLCTCGSTSQCTVHPF